MMATTIVLHDDERRPGMRHADKQNGVGQVVLSFEGGGLEVAQLTLVFGKEGRRQALALAKCLIEVSETVTEWEAPAPAPPAAPEESVDDTGVPF